MKITPEQKKVVKEAIEDAQLITKTDIEITPTSEEPVDDLKEDSGVKLLSLSEDQITRLRDKVFQFMDSIKADTDERKAKWEGYECQYEGEVVSKSPQIEFELSVPVTQVKCDAVERLIIKSFLESDPKFSCKPRPESLRKGMTDEDVKRVVTSQEDYLDYQLDERIDIASPLRKTVHEAVMLDGGILKIPYVYKRKRKTREEFYQGKLILQPDGTLKPKEIDAFLRNYPTAMLPGEPGNAQYNKLIKGEDVSFESKYWATVFDDAKPVFVQAKNFLVRPKTEGYEGLCDEEIYGEREPHTLYELKKKERAGEMENVDKLIKEEKDKTQNKEEYSTKEFNILVMRVMFDLDDQDEDEDPIICMFDEDSKVFLGAYDWPYPDVECIHVPFYISGKTPGFWKPGLSGKLRDSNLAQSAMLNMMLTEAWQQLITTPIAKEGSDVVNQFLAGRWAPGVPIMVPEETGNLQEELGFLEKPQHQVAGQLINILLFLSKYDDDRTGVSSLATGKESPTDPSAPAAKTAMLLRQSGINIEDYIRCMLPSFNKIAEIIMKLSYQMSSKGRKYRARQIAQRVTGSSLFNEISRDDLILETVIQANAASFEFDKINEKNGNLAIFQILRNDPLVARNPKALRELAISLLESWSPMWKAKAEELVLTDQQFNMEIAKIGINALGTYMQALSQQAQTTGARPNPQLSEYLQMTSAMLNQAFNPQPEKQK